MVDYQDQNTVASDYAVLRKLWHVIDGVFIWEFLITLDYEWDVIRGRRPRRWTIWIYSFTRVATLMFIILNLVGFNVTNPINCQAWATSTFVFPCIVFGSASLLIMLRIFAIWNREKFVVIIATCVWMTNIAFMIYGVVLLHATWLTEADTCILINPQTAKPSIISSLVTDVVLLLIMLMGLLRSRIRKGGAFGVGRMLWNQGLIWLLLATLAEVPPAVFMCLDLNLPLSYIFQAPNIVTISIAATMMYRSLVNFGSSDIVYESGDLQKSMRTGSARVLSGPIPLNRLELVRGTEIDQCPTSSLPPSRCDVKSKLATQVRPEGSNYTLV